jgi:hypothetical protein
MNRSHWGRNFCSTTKRKRATFITNTISRKKTLSQGDNQVRQAGALWGVSLIHRENPSPESKAAVEKGLDFFRNISQKDEAGNTFVVYPKDSQGSTGTIALLVLSLTELLQTEISSTEREQYSEELNGYLGFLLTLRDEKGQFFSRFDLKTGEGFGKPSPYFDGEALLALTRAQKYTETDGLVEMIMESASVMYSEHIIKARAINPDSDTTKGFYQWGSMAFYEIYTAGWDGYEVYAERTIELAYWMIDTHRTLERTRNTAYAYEGMISAWELARLTGDTDALRKIGKVIDTGLYKLTSWQVGSSIANRYIKRFMALNPQKDPLAHGGITNKKDETTLRIDVTQHQMHAVLLARKFVYR